jgi:hypothetical protein
LQDGSEPEKTPSPRKNVRAFYVTRQRDIQPLVPLWQLEVIMDGFGVRSMELRHTNRSTALFHNKEGLAKTIGLSVPHAET